MLPLTGSANACKNLLAKRKFFRYTTKYVCVFLIFKAMSALATFKTGARAAESGGVLPCPNLQGQADAIVRPYPSPVARFASRGAAKRKISTSSPCALFLLAKAARAPDFSSACAESYMRQLKQNKNNRLQHHQIAGHVQAPASEIRKRGAWAARHGPARPVKPQPRAGGSLAVRKARAWRVVMEGKAEADYLRISRAFFSSFTLSLPLSAMPCPTI